MTALITIMGCHLRFVCASISIATVVAVKMGVGGMEE